MSFRITTQKKIRIDTTQNYSLLKYRYCKVTFLECSICMKIVCVFMSLFVFVEHEFFVFCATRWNGLKVKSLELMKCWLYKLLTGRNPFVIACLWLFTLRWWIGNCAWYFFQGNIKKTCRSHPKNEVKFCKTKKVEVFLEIFL